MMKIKRTAGALVAGVAAISLGVVPFAAAAPGDLSEAEAAELAFMREEERVARDLYQAFFDMYDGARPFSRIVNAEQQHYDQVGNLLVTYGIADPSAGLSAGTYSNQALQELYNTWYAAGSASLEAAYQVGVDLETRDIADLEDAIAATGTDAVKVVFERLQAGSENHLTAFTNAVNGQIGTGIKAGNPQGNGQRAGMAGQGMGRGGQGQQGAGLGTGAPQGQQAGRQGTGSQNGTQQGPRDGSGPLGDGSGICPVTQG